MEKRSTEEVHADIPQGTLSSLPADDLLRTFSYEDRYPSMTSAKASVRPSPADDDGGWGSCCCCSFDPVDSNVAEPDDAPPAVAATAATVAKPRGSSPLAVAAAGVLLLPPAPNSAGPVSSSRAVSS